MRRRLLFKNIEISPQDAECCDVVFCKPDGLLVIRRNSNEWKKDEEPIGIVVIPASHGVLKDGTGTVNQCGVMSIVPMDYSTPEKGGIREKGICWGYYKNDISGRSDGLGRSDSVTNGLLNYQHSVKTASDTSNVADGYSSNSGAHIPRQGSIGSIPTRDDSPYAPSPYIGSDYKSGGYNESYGLKDGVVGTETNNALSDFKGIVNTKILTDLGQSDWKTSSTITNSKEVGYTPAACCCARFKTNGTKSFAECTTEELRNGTGFWYLPAEGELGYIIPRLFDINDTITKLKKVYGVGVILDTNSNYWSSSESSNYNIYVMYMKDGDVSYFFKDYNYYVRAFLRL